MPRKPQPPGRATMAQPPLPPRRWIIYKLAAKQTRVGEVEDATEAEAIEMAVARR